MLISGILCTLLFSCFSPSCIRRAHAILRPGIVLKLKYFITVEFTCFNALVQCFEIKAAITTTLSSC